jgi:predicted nuclease of predicted toxin-antitoxin system
MQSNPVKEFHFLVDVNLPKRFSFFNSPLFTHIVDIDAYMTDQQVWDYAIENDKVILTKDADFYDKFMSSKVSPKVVYFQLGNLSLKELHNFFMTNWAEIISHLEDGSMLVVQKDQIKVIK